MNLEQFNKYINRLSLHDWQYQYRDDYTKYKSYNYDEAILRLEALEEPLLQEAYDLYELFKKAKVTKETLNQRINEIRLELLITT